MTFSNGIIKSLERELLTSATLMRIIDEPDYKSACAALKEQGFGKGVTADGDAEKLFLAETLALDDFAREFSPGKQYSEFCLSGIDFYNAERYLRSEYLKGFEFTQTRTGLVKDIPAALKKGGNEVPAEIGKAYAEGKELFEKGKATGAEISSIFLKAKYSRLLKKCGGELGKFVKNDIDAKNVSSALRVKNEEDLDALFIDGGNLPKSDVAFICAAEAERVEKKFAFTPFKDMIATAESEKAAGLPLVKFEAEADGFALRELKKRKYDTEGATPFLLYYLYKSAEIKNARIIVAGKRAKASAEDIKRRLRTGYDG